MLTLIKSTDGFNYRWFVHNGYSLCGHTLIKYYNEASFTFANKVLYCSSGIKKEQITEQRQRQNVWFCMQYVNKEN